MSHFAKIQNGIAVQVIVAEQEFIDNQPGEWVQTSYNTRGGKHYAPNSHVEDNKPALRKNFAGIGHTYDRVRDAFYAPQLYPSWSLNETSCQWTPPTPMPDDGEGYIWDEENTSWKWEPTPEMPDDGKMYTWDKSTTNWREQP